LDSAQQLAMTAGMYKFLVSDYLNPALLPTGGARSGEVCVYCVPFLHFSSTETYLNSFIFVSRFFVDKFPADLFQFIATGAFMHWSTYRVWHIRIRTDNPAGDFGPLHPAVG
jgi:hypothetical protein